MSGVADTAKSLFGPDTPVKEKQQERLKRRREFNASQPLFKSSLHDGEGQQDKKTRPPSKRKWSPPMDVADVQKVLDEQEQRRAGAAAKKRARCCKIECIRKFADSAPSDVAYNAQALSIDQDRMRKLEREIERKQLVQENVPQAVLGKGSMMAANSPVCNKAFMLLFGVSETLISSLKRTLRARASSSVTR